MNLAAGRPADGGPWIAAPLASTLPVANAATAGACDRPCLKSLLDGYLAAVIRHDPAAAALAGSYRHTENAINVPLGKGVWQSVTGLGQVQRRYLDPVSGQAAYYGILDEGDKLAIVTARLRIENRMITEAEWYVAREADPGLPGSTPPSCLESARPHRNAAARAGAAPVAATAARDHDRDRQQLL